ncbi:hypothetical protein SAMN05216474_2091 [Lishizhenia tianjinensis]|uniref:Uncharacterized protein n=1 Tax=Lishizhenia tianjinensis TaxID=477690 RepID=A0A1I7AH99_9FLAO|nr:hypothetical protein [Lishizhenia tianjinensis]SFT74319.1 hypothetical protein SAMN05216474_2091 [Lishizhenia tianjinensis]
MKKLNLAILASTLMLSFGCQKEIESTTPTTQPESETLTNLTPKCTPPTPTWYWYDNGGTNYSAGDYCCVPDAAFYNAAYSPYSSNWNPVYAQLISFEQVHGTPDVGLLVNFFEAIDNNQNNYQVISSFINSEEADLIKYFDPCVLDKLKNHDLHPTMHLYGNIAGGGHFEYLMIYENSTLQNLKYVYPVNLN